MKYSHSFPNLFVTSGTCELGHAGKDVSDSVIKPCGNLEILLICHLCLLPQGQQRDLLQAQPAEAF